MLAPLSSRDTYHWGWWVYALAVATAVPCMWRRAAPFAALLCATPAAMGVSLFAHYASRRAVRRLRAHPHRRRARAAVARQVTAAAVVFTTLISVNSPQGALFSLLPMAAAYASGTVPREQRGRAAAQAERLAAAERDAVGRAERAAGAERARIAREMHDILGHAVSLMVVQAEAGPVPSAPTRTVRWPPLTPSPAPAGTPCTSCGGCSACCAPTAPPPSARRPPWRSCPADRRGARARG